MGTSQGDPFAIMKIFRLDLLIMRMVSEKFVDKIKIEVLCSIAFSQKSCCLLDSVEKYHTTGKDADANIIQLMYLPYQIIKAQTHTQYMQLLMLFHINYRYMNARQ
jgi:hypothetical protein